jgi:drug/metabolite transporter (DMT)-like permease
MIPLIFSILCSSFIFVLFKIFPKYSIDTFQAIVFNYITAFSCGILFFGHEWNPEALTIGLWPVYAVICAVLFISLFILMGSSSQKNGVALTSIAVKMSMAISMLLIIILYREPLSFFKIGGIVLAFVGVFLVSFSRSEKKKTNNSLWLLLILFVGSGVLDFILNYVQKYELYHLTPSLFSAFGFGISGIIGLIILIYRINTQNIKVTLKNIFAGVLLGIPNYFSIYLLILSYKSTGWNDSTVLAVINISVVMISAIIGFIAFKENLTARKIIGLVSAIGAIILLYLANIN